MQKYVHDLDAWNALPVEEQERVVGRTKLADIEMPDDVKPKNSHLALNVITGPDGTELKILRDNMPFGNLGQREFGTYYIAYARTPQVTERMLTNMFIGDPPGNYDRILDFSTALTGTSSSCRHRISSTTRPLLQANRPDASTLPSAGPVAPRGKRGCEAGDEPVEAAVDVHG